MAAMSRLCDIDHVRPAVGSIQVIRPGQPPETLYLCEEHLAERRRMGSGLGSGFGGLGMFDDFFSRFFSDSAVGAGGGVGSPGGTGGAPARRGVEQIDVTERFSDATRELLQRAAQTAATWGSLDLDTDHLLIGAVGDEVVMNLLEQAGADPKSIAAEIEDAAEKGQPLDVAPSLAPDAKRAILGAYEEAMELGASYIGPEHVLLSLARDEDAEAGATLRKFGLSHTKLRGLVVRGVDREGQARERSTTKTVDEYSRTSPSSPARASSTR
jgi:ATP-dependent Clp protease ATP-binding subunit ClpC